MKDDLDKLIEELNEQEKVEILARLGSKKELTGDDEFRTLCKLLQSAHWPKAVPDVWICKPDSKEDKMERAHEILRFLTPTCQNKKKLLDFGCGEGHVTMASTAEMAIGYDLVQPEHCDFQWEKMHAGSKLLTNHLPKVESHAPYDVVLLFDVLDHTDDPVQVLKTAKDLVDEGGVIFGHCHPWCGRHGGHLYQQINKAFVHLIFTEDELASMGYEVLKMQRVVKPNATYKQWLEDAGFQDVNFYLDVTEPESFFRNNPHTRNRIQEALHVDRWPRHQIRQNGVDFSIRSC